MSTDAVNQLQSIDAEIQAVKADVLTLANGIAAAQGEIENLKAQLGNPAVPPEVTGAILELANHFADLKATADAAAAKLTPAPAV